MAMDRADEEMVRRLADGEDPWAVDPEYGCTNPLTGYFPSTEVAAERQRRAVHNGYELVRVSREMVEQLIEDESGPVVVIALKRLDDGTCELWLRNSPVAAEFERLRSAFADLLREANDMRCYVPDYFAKKWHHDDALKAAREALEAGER